MISNSIIAVIGYSFLGLIYGHLSEINRKYQDSPYDTGFVLVCIIAFTTFGLCIGLLFDAAIYKYQNHNVNMS